MNSEDFTSAAFNLGFNNVGGRDGISLPATSTNGWTGAVFKKNIINKYWMFDCHVCLLDL